MEKYRNTLKKFSLKATPQRLAVHEAMIELGHASADMVSQYIEESGKARITVASVYNILTQMALLGVYQHRMSCNNKMYFDVNTHKHCHLYDRVNHCYKDICSDKINEAINNCLGKKRFKGYTVENIDVQIIARPTKRNILGK